MPVLRLARGGSKTFVLQKFSSKLLLFGEYALLYGAPALCVPAPRWSGFWEKKDPRIGKDATLEAWAASDHLRRADFFDVGRFREDVEQGWRFASNIPQGYGLGSSGALCAGAYARYGALDTDDLALLKTRLAQMESWFHGASSGIDPLTSLLDRPLLIEGERCTALAQGAVAASDAPFQIRLFDTRIARATGPLVTWFKTQMDGKGALFEAFEQVHAPDLRQLSAAWLNRDAALVWDKLRAVSAWQYAHLQPMIPPEFRDIWLDILRSKDLIVKLCGAGGGGFMLCFARNGEDLSAVLPKGATIDPFERPETDEAI